MGEYVDAQILNPNMQCGTTLRDAVPYITEAQRVGRREIDGPGSKAGRRHAALGKTYGPKEAGPPRLSGDACGKQARERRAAYRDYDPITYVPPLPANARNASIDAYLAQFPASCARYGNYNNCGPAKTPASAPEVYTGGCPSCH